MKLTTAKRTFLALATTLALAPAAASAQDANAEGITGTWNHQLTVRNCTTGAVIAQSFPTSSYVEGGVVIELAPAPGPTLRTPSLGVWKYVGNQKYQMSMKYFRFNPDGSYAGKTIIDSDITHLRNDTLSQVAVVRIFNAAGGQIASGCATLTSVRFTGDN
ncbi:MAG TPA: hypothetical protein VFI26_08170 [Lysobacter sp.]|jgi:hypothetical protein|nr:hypothetical protein [Lysobacter sp.]